jgi:membrane protease YdiL (CAAX protease family)
MDQKPVINYPSQFAFLIGLMGVFMIISAFLVILIGANAMNVSAAQVPAELNRPEHVSLSRWLNTLASLFTFLLPAVFVARIVSKKPFYQIGFRSAVSVKQIILILALTLTSVMLSGALGELNEWIPIPQELYKWAKQKEDLYKETMMSLATMRSVSDYLLGLLVLAAGPAIFEEVFFRGVLQKIMVGWTKNKWAGIIITGILFSAIHISYFGFIPRLALGIVLGLIFYYSKNIWLSILLHFLNNALVVTQLYIMSQKGKPVAKTMDESIPMWWGILAVAALIVLFRSFKKESVRVLAAKEQSIHSSPENIVS